MLMRSTNSYDCTVRPQFCTVQWFESADDEIFTFFSLNESRLENHYSKPVRVKSHVFTTEILSLRIFSPEFGRACRYKPSKSTFHPTVFWNSRLFSRVRMLFKKMVPVLGSARWRIKLWQTEMSKNKIITFNCGCKYCSRIFWNSTYHPTTKFDEFWEFLLLWLIMSVFRWNIWYNINTFICVVGWAKLILFNHLNISV